MQNVWRQKGTRYQEKNTISTEKFGGGIMVWGLITADGPGDLVFLDGTMNQHVYKNVLESHLVPFLKKNQFKNFIFQQDGAPCHTSKLLKEFFTEAKIQLLEWTAQSPDINPIEHVWAIIKRILGNRKFNNFEDLKSEILRIWRTEITPELCRNLIASMPCRIDEVIKSKGGSTRY